MKLSTRFRFFYVTLYNLFRYVLVTGLDNRLFAPLFGFRLCNLKKPPEIKEPRLRFDGALRDYGHFVQCGELFMNFDLCGLREKTKSRKPGNQCWHFQDGFMQISGMTHPPAEANLPFGSLDKWVPARGKTPSAADVVHREPVLLISNYHKLNPAIILRQVYALLYNLEALGIRPEDTTLLFFHNDPEEKLDAITSNLFKVRHVRDMHGVHLFQNAFYFLSDSSYGWQHRKAVEVMRRHCLPAFGITPRRRGEDINRITLVSRRDYKVYWGLNRSVRKISNEDEIIAVLRGYFPAAEVNAVAMEDLSVEQQLRLIHETDILIGMHGAALGFATLLPENAGLLELYPAYFVCSHWFTVFYLLAVGGGIHYRRWINYNPKREYCSREWAQEIERLKGGIIPRRDFTEVPPQAVLRQVKALQRAMQKAHEDSKVRG